MEEKNKNILIKELEEIIPTLTWLENTSCSIKADYDDRHRIIAIVGHSGSGFTKLVEIFDIKLERVIFVIGSEYLVAKCYENFTNAGKISLEGFIKKIEAAIRMSRIKQKED